MYKVKSLNIAKSYIPIERFTGNSANGKSDKRLYIETYGCQMNFADTEIVEGIMSKGGYKSSEIDEADVIMLNTCSIRENAEAKVKQRLTEIRKYKRRKPGVVVGIIGCMAERLRKDLLDKAKLVDLVVGPDEYRKIPDLIDNLVETGERGIAVRLSRVETYDDITPIRKDGISAWLSIMRGCDKFCSFCVVPYTRGRERSRTLQGIVNEVKQLWNEGFKDVTLLGQNVNSYRSAGNDFADLLRECAIAAPEMRIRFTTSHPQDYDLKLIETIAKYDNLCKYIHLPVQSGSNRVLDLMKRNYTVEHYLGLINKTRELIPDASFSTDIISGFPTESEEDHKLTLDLMREVKYDGAYMFRYSPREHTKAYEMKDDIDEEVKSKRLMDIVEIQREISEELNRKTVGNTYDIIIDSLSKKSNEMLIGRTDGNKAVVIPKNGTNIGDKVKVKVLKANSATLFGEVIY